MALRAAHRADMATVLEWIPDEQSCRLWAGPRLQAPTTAATAWADIEASGDNAYVLPGPALEVAAFGQALRRSWETVHLARLIVNPRFRRQGIGRRLCLGLMEVAQVAHGAERFTLNVYESNQAAAALYTSLGFVAEGHDGAGLIAMGGPATIA